MKRGDIVVAALLAGLLAALTIFFRVPIPRTAGYLNIGDILVIFVGLRYGPVMGFIVGGVGSGLADLVGFPVFAPITLVAKGLEGMLPGIFRTRRPILGSFLGGAAMMIVYFVAEYYAKSMGPGAALTELPFNGLQVAVGISGGLALRTIMDKWFKHE